MNPLQQQQQQQQQSQQLPVLDRLIRPEQIGNLVCLTKEEKQRIAGPISGLWKLVHDNPEGSVERAQAHRRLAELSNKLRAQMQKWKQEHPDKTADQLAAESAAMRANAQGQGQGQGQGQVPQQQQMPAHPNIPGLVHNAANFAVNQVSASVKQQVQDLQLVIPPQLAGRSELERQQWSISEKRKFAMLAHNLEVVHKTTKDFTNSVQSRMQETTFTEEQKNELQNRLRQYQLMSREYSEAITKFRAQQAQYKAQIQQMRQAAQRPDQPDGQQSTNENDQPVTDTKPDEIVKSEPPSNVPNSQPPPQQARANFGQNAIHNNPTEQQQAPHPPVQTHPQQNLQHQQKEDIVPLTHKDALARAQSYSHLPQSRGNTTPNHQDNSRGGSAPTATFSTRDTNRPLSTMQPLTHVQMGPARPTYTGGPSTGAAGPMGQPAIQKMPGYVLEGEGDHVLSKKKLRELVREVTGGSGGDGEMLEPEVEETLLEVADEFVDNVILQGCKVAKLRSGEKLEVRDIQLILERNYNIRIPGYASDELRTVRKIQPTQGWVQKMSAVQAAKVTGGKGDL